MSSRTSSENESHQQLGFIATLPGDIVLEILSYVSQQDCLTFMAVCREWYTAIPEYTRSVWKDFLLNTQIAKDHRRRELCLGSHVKRVTVEPFKAGPVSEQELRTLIQKLLDWGCTEIDSLELFSCTTTNLDECLDLVKLIAPRLTSLKMINHASVLNILHVLYAFPNLTHLWCKQSNLADHGRHLIAQPLDIPADYYTKITHLRLDIPLVKAQKEFILRRCPDLRSFVDTGKSVGIGTETKVDLGELFVWCPKISFLETGCHLSDEHPDPSISYIGDGNGLHFFNTTDDYGTDNQITRLLTKNQDTLEHLSIRRVKLGDDWSRVLRSLHLQNLKSWTSKSIRFSVDTFIALLNHCPCLVKLDLYSPRRLTINSTAAQSIHPKQRLKFMDLDGIALEEDLSLVTLLGRFPVLETLLLRRTTLPVAVPPYSESPSHLKRLHLPDVLWYFDNYLEQDKESLVAYFLRYLTYNAKIEILQLPRVSMMGRRSLLAIAMIPTLKILEVHLDRGLQEEELLEVIRMLRETAIVSLILGNVYSLSFAACDALADIPQLERLTMVHTGFGSPKTRISGDDLQHMLSKSPRLMVIRFHDVTVVQNNGKSITRNQLFALIKEQTIQLDETFKKSHWNVYTDMHSNSTDLRNIVIKRV